MSSISFNDKQILEDLFGMATGGVLDFSNRTFQECVFDTLGIDVYKKYAGEPLSKAKILRRLFGDLNDQQLKLLLTVLMDHMDEFCRSKNVDRINKARNIINKLGNETVRERKLDDDGDEKGKNFNYRYFLNRLIDLSKKNTSEQNKGYDFEKYLRDLFDAVGLSPRRSYRVEGEQIDGSICFNGDIYLIEAKWTCKPVNRNDLVVFNDKVSRKSNFTRGIFVSYSGYVENAVETFANGRVSSIVLMDIREVVWSLENEINIKDVLSKKIRKLTEEGRCYYNIIGGM